jgi:hypothetical protein
MLNTSWIRPALSALAALTLSLSLVTESRHRCPQASDAPPIEHHQQGSDHAPVESCECLGHCCTSTGDVPGVASAAVALDVPGPLTQPTQTELQRIATPLRYRLPWPNAPPRPTSITL